MMETVQKLILLFILIEIIIMPFGMANTWCMEMEMVQHLHRYQLQMMSLRMN